MKNSRKLRCFRAAKVSRHDTFPVGRGCGVNSGEALAAGVSVVDSSGGIGMEILMQIILFDSILLLRLSLKPPRFPAAALLLFLPICFTAPRRGRIVQY